MEYEIERSFLEWTSEEVVKWLQTLSLSRDYSNHFKDHGIDGSSLIKLNPGALDELGITEGGDRVKILQQLTTMRADLIPSRAFSPVKRVQSPAAKIRRYSEISRPAQNRLHGRLMRQAVSSSACTLEKALPPNFQRHAPIGESISEKTPSQQQQQQGESSRSSVDPSGSSQSSLSRLSSSGQLSSDSPEGSRISSPTKSRGSTSPHHFLEGGRNRVGGREGERRGSKDRDMELGETVVIRGDPTLRGHNLKRLSKSLDGLFLDGEDVFSLAASEPAEHRDGSNTRLVEILREENATLKKELESYYNRVRKLQKLEREVERIREAHRLLEASASRRAKLEATMRDKLEQEIRKLKEDNIQQKAELKSNRKEGVAGSDGGNEQGKGKSREIRRRDTMIMKLIKKNKDAAAVREQLEKDLEAARAQLEERRASEAVEHGGEQEPSEGSNGGKEGQKSSTEIETNIALVYSESIEKLKGVLVAMQNASHKREKLEKQLREQLQSEINQLKGGGGGTAAMTPSSSSPVRGVTGSSKVLKEKSVSVAELQKQILLLEADVAKWEHKCLELVAEKYMALETAVVPRDTRLAHLERALAEKTDIVHELRQQRSMYLSQISDANQRLAEMETRAASLQSTIEEKDSLIQMLQQSFLDPDDYSSTFSQEDQLSSFQLHHSPVSAKKFTLNGATMHILSGTSASGTSGSGHGMMKSRASERGHYEQLSLHIPPPPLSSIHHRFSNGAHAHGGGGGGGGGRTPRHSEGSRGYPVELGSPVRGYVNCSLPTSPVKAMQYERSGSLSPIKRPNERGTHKYYTLELSDDMMDNSASGHYYRGQLPPVATGGGGGGGGVYGGSHSSPPTSHKLSVPSSNSAPNSPSVRKVSHKPRISQPNLHHIQVPPVHGGGGGHMTAGTSRLNGGGSGNGREPNLSHLTRLGSPPKYRNPKGAKSNTGVTRRNHIQPSIDEVKSKTPPPNYKLDSHHHHHHHHHHQGNNPPTMGGQSTSNKMATAVAIGSGSPNSVRGKGENGSPHLSTTHHGSGGGSTGGGYHGENRAGGDHHQKQRHHSVDDVLSGHQDVTLENGNLNLSVNSNSSSSLALFESLIGDSLPKTSSPLVGGVGKNGSSGGSGAGAGRRHNMNSHRHSKSSPTRELVHL